MQCECINPPFHTVQQIFSHLVEKRFRDIPEFQICKQNHPEESDPDSDKRFFTLYSERALPAEEVLQYQFFSDFWLNFVCMLIIVRLFSNLRCWIVRHLSFLEKKKTELIYLHCRPFYNCSCFLVDLFCKKHPKRCALCFKQPEPYIKIISWTKNDIEKIQTDLNYRV